jgi:phosphoribosylamine---glycine ligase
MGAYAPAPIVTPEVLRFVEERIIRPTLEGMSKEGRAYTGCLYLGLMLTPQGPKVVEYNARFGDPETQVVLPLYEGDLAQLLMSASNGTVASLPRSPIPSSSAVCVVMASGGYPDTYRTGLPVEGLDEVSRMDGVVVFHAGTKLDGGRIVTSGGRVLGVTALRGGALRESISHAYAAVKKIRFDGAHFRNDIGQKALSR